MKVETLFSTPIYTEVLSDTSEKTLSKYVADFTKLFYRDWQKSMHIESVEHTIPKGERLLVSGTVTVHINCVVFDSGGGDLLLIDPRGGINWNGTDEGENLNLKFHRIKAEPNRVVIFPTYVLFETDINRSVEQQRLRLSTYAVLATTIFNKPLVD